MYEVLVTLFSNFLSGSDKYCHIYDVEKAELIEKISEEYSVGLNDCAWFDNGHIITVGDDCQVRLIDLEVVSHHPTIQNYAIVRLVWLMDDNVLHTE
jgi:WD40 repeat protein